MLERLKILTVTHRQTNLNQIGNYVIKADSDAELCCTLQSLRDQFHLDEILYLATCNRVMYCFVTDHPLDHFFAAHFLQKINPDLPLEQLEDLDEAVQLLQAEAALSHMLEVAASIDSLVIGERQILRQLREAYEKCREWGLTGDYLRLVTEQAILAAKEVYAQTRIGEKPVSIVSLAVQKLLRTHLPKDARILLIGAGQTNQLVAKFLAKHNFTQVVVFNRSLARAQTVAELINGQSFPLEELEHYTGGFDALIVCTGATEALITPDLYEHLLQGETEQKVVIDLAIPNNVASNVRQQYPMQYIAIEGLRQLAKENLAFRSKEVDRARQLLHSYLGIFPDLLRQRRLEIALRQVPEKIKAVKRKAINEVFRKEVEVLDDPTRELVERMLSYMEKKCIGIPMKVARKVVLEDKK